MNFKEIVERTRTVHRFDPSFKIDEALIEEALALSLMAPNHKFTFPWKYYWPKVETRQKIIDIFSKAKGKGDLQKEEAVRKTFESMSEIIFFAQKLSSNEFTRKEDYATLSCSIQIFAMFLASHGINYKWSTSSVIEEDSLYDVLEINKEEEEIVGMIFIGLPAGEIPARRRPDLKEVLVRI